MSINQNIHEALGVIKPRTDLKEIPRAKFRLPNGNIVELLADGYHLPRYLARGFMLIQNVPVVEQDKGEVDEYYLLTCSVCGFHAKNLTALGQHRRTHNGRITKNKKRR